MIKESNGITDASGADAKKGMVAYNFAPSAWRAGKDFAEVMAQAGTAAQPHATCLDAPTLESEAAIKAGRAPTRSTTTSRSRPSPPASRMTRRSGSRRWRAPVYPGRPGDGGEPHRQVHRARRRLHAGRQITTQASALAEGLTKPIEERFNAATASNTTLTSQVTALTNEVNSLKSQVAGMQAAATPIKLTVASAKAKTVASKGAAVTVNAQAQKPVKVTVSLTEAQARKLKLGSSVLGSKTVTTDAAGNATATVKVSKAAAKALKALKKSVSVTVEAISGDRFATAKSKFTR